MAHRARGNLTGETNPDGGTTTSVYDSANRKTSTTDPEGNTTTFIYDTIGHLMFMDDPQGNRTTYTYDENGNVTRASYPGGLTETASYNRNNRPERQSGEGITLTLTYDPAGRVKTASNGVATTTAAYDEVGNITGKTLTHPTGEESFSYSYTPGRRMESATGSQGTTTYSYDPSGRMVSKTYPNGIQAHYSHDDSGALTSLEVNNGEIPVKTYQVTRDNRANVTSVIEDATQTTSYTYDASSRLTGENNPQMGNVTYSYDSAGNRLTRDKQGGPPVSYAYNTADQLTSDSQGNSYTYNTRGDLTTIENGSYAEQYAWDGKGRLTGITDTDGNATSYSYDPRDRTFASMVNDEIAVHLYDMTTDREIALLDEDQDLTSLNHSGAGGLISSTTDNQTSYYSYNPHSDVSLITDEAGETTTELHYDAWGNVAEETDEPYTYLGKHQRRNSHSTGLIKMGARFYNPDTGRFISRDPLRGHEEIPVSRNPYVYSHDDPVNRTDLSGEYSEDGWGFEDIPWLEEKLKEPDLGIMRWVYESILHDLYRARRQRQKQESKTTKEAQPAKKPSCVSRGYSGSGTWQLSFKTGLFKLIPIATFSITAGVDAEVTTKKHGSEVLSSKAACEGHIFVQPLTADVTKETDHWAVQQTGLSISILDATLSVHFKGKGWCPPLRKSSSGSESPLLHPETIYTPYYERYQSTDNTELKPDKGKVYVILGGSRTEGYAGSDFLKEEFVIQ